MSVVPSGSQFIGISPDKDLSNKKSGIAAIVAVPYTIEDLAIKIAEIQATTTTTTTSTSTTTTSAQALILGFDNISSANTLVGDASDVADWNTFFDLPTFGTPFTSVGLDGNNVKLFGGANIEVKQSLFIENSNILSINDQPGSITSVGDDAFIRCSLNYLIFPQLQSIGAYCFLENAVLASFSAQNLLSIGDGSFEQCLQISTINIPSCTSLGGTVDEDFVFDGITGQTISLTIPSALMTVNGGNPDGDIQYLQANNTVTITTV